MKKNDFYYVFAKNFRCFGPEGIEIKIDELGNLIVIKGENLDRQPKNGGTEEDEIKSRNGVGKSSIAEIFAVGLYGRPIKQIRDDRSPDQVVNNKTGKDMMIDIRWNKYRVVRRRKPKASLELWESEDHIWNDKTKITLGGMPATQKKIEELLGWNYQTFVNILIVTDKNKDAFLECDTPNKRKIVENLLSLEDYALHQERAKEDRKVHQNVVTTMVSTYERILSELESAKRRVKQVQDQEGSWRESRKTELVSLIQKIKQKQAQLASTDIGNKLIQYNEAQEQIKSLNDSILPMQQSLEKILSITEELNKKIETNRQNKKNISLDVQSLDSEIRRIGTEIKSQESVLKNFAGKHGTKCPSCRGTVNEENYADILAESRKVIEEHNVSLVTLASSLAEMKSKETLYTNEYQSLDKATKLAHQKTSEINSKMVKTRGEINELSKIEKPEANTDQRLLQDQIVNLKETALAKKAEMEGLSPYVEIYESAVSDVVKKENEAKSKKEELVVAEAELPYYDFWVKAFGDNGIRKLVIDGIIPALNSRVAYWMQHLIDGKVKLVFDNELNERIENVPADGEPFVYEQMSNGEQRRLNLAVSQAFSYVQMLNTGVSSNIIFLDEVTTNVDPLGVEGIYKMILELSKTKHVFVTTHDKDLLDLMAGCQTIHLVRKNSFTTRVL